MIIKQNILNVYYVIEPHPGDWRKGGVPDFLRHPSCATLGPADGSRCTRWVGDKERAVAMVGGGPTPARNICCCRLASASLTVAAPASQSRAPYCMVAVRCMVLVLKGGGRRYFYGGVIYPQCTIMSEDPPPGRFCHQNMNLIKCIRQLNRVFLYALCIFNVIKFIMCIVH